MGFDLKIFLLLVLSHILGDVVFSSHRISLLKRSSIFHKQVFGHLSHVFIHSFFVSVLLVFFTENLIWLKAAACVFAIHITVDILKTSLERKLYGADRIVMKRPEIIEWITGKNSNSSLNNKEAILEWALINFLDQTFHIAGMYVIAAIFM